MLRRTAMGILCSAVIAGPAAEAMDPPNSGAAPSDGGALVEAVRVELNRWLPAETYLHYISTKPGDRYDELRLRDDFRHLWQTGLLDDLLLDVSDGRLGKVLTFRVSERKRIGTIDYRGSGAVTKSGIEDKLKEKEIEFKTGSLFDLLAVKRVEGLIRGMLQDAGHPFATVRHEVKAFGTGSVQVSFVLSEGVRARVREIAFLGNRAFSDATLRRQLVKIGERRFWNLSWLRGTTTFTEQRWREAAEHLRDFYLDHGYVEASIGEPVVTYYDGEPGLLKHRVAKGIRLEIPVDEGLPYRVGALRVEGLTVFKEASVRSLLKLRAGQTYRDSRIKKGYEKLRDLYGTYGYFNWTPLTKRDVDHQKGLVDVTLEMQEEKRYYVGRIRFVGNTSTQDRVLRREVYLNEGGVFDTEALKLSIKRINQLGYFKPMEKMPDLQASSRGDDRVDVTFHVEEENRNQFSLGGGMSAMQGLYASSSFSTANFLGGGETVQLSAQQGSRIKDYQLAVTEPYLFDRAITAGFSVYKRRLETYGYQDLAPYVDDRVGASFTGGVPLRAFTRLYATYTYEIVNVEKLDASRLKDLGLTTTTYTYRIEDYGRRHESRLSPSLIRNTVDNPYTPHSGMRLTATLSAAGGPLGGTLSYLSPALEGVVYLRQTRRTALGLRAKADWVTPYGDTATVSSSTGRDGLPFYHRFSLGGETSVRGYEPYSLRPRDANDVPLVGSDGSVVYGNRSMLFNAEYYVDVLSSLRFLLFFDAGAVAQHNNERLALREMKVSTGAELRFTMPVLNLPMRLIYAINPNRGPYYSDPSRGAVPLRTFKFAVGSTF
jgi:outer membrane protein insertion porin family